LYAFGEIKFMDMGRICSKVSAAGWFEKNRLRERRHTIVVFLIVTEMLKV
jgi:predicted nucleic acid-binding Zn ribbon protein